MGVDRDSGLVHTVKVTATNVHDVNVTAELLTGEEETVHGDSGYIGCEKRPEAIIRNKAGKQIRYKIGSAQIKEKVKIELTQQLI